MNLIPRNGLLVVNEDDENILPLLKTTHCPVKCFGIKGAESVEFSDQGACFNFDGFRFHLPLFGELNVRNALGVIVVGRHCGLSNQQIQSGFDTFKGIRRRMEVRGEFQGVTVVDDFAHHPTAIRETLKAAKLRFPGRRLWAVFEPRSNTTRRNIFQEQLADAFFEADFIVLSEVARLDQIPKSERLEPETLINKLKLSGKKAAYVLGAEAIVEHLKSRVEPGDVVCVLSNGSFDNIHEQLLEMLKA